MTDQAPPGATEPLDLLVHADWIASVDTANTVYEKASLGVRGTEITGIYSQTDAARLSAAEELHLDGQLLCPGLINAHGHAAMTLLRGFADDLPLMSWLQDHIWPAEANYVDAEFVEDGSKLAIAEMLCSGTTCFTDMYFFPNVTASQAHGLGIRAQIAFPILELETAWASSRDEYIDKGLQVMDDFKHSRFVDVCFGPHAPYTVNRNSLEKIAILANELDAGVHIHVHETEQEVASFLAEHGVRPLSMLNAVGLASPRLQCAHMCYVDDGDLRILADTGSHVAHCLRSNLKLASGFCPLEQLITAGVNVALGTDGAASNNRLDMLSEMNLSAIVAKAVAKDASAVSAVQALRNATINGAKAIGREHELGSLEAGKQADFFAINLDKINCWPLYEPISQLVYSASSEHISHVWTAGQQRVKDGTVQSIDATELRRKANYWRDLIKA